MNLIPEKFKNVPVSRGIPSEPAEEVLRQDLEKWFQGLLDVICVLEPNELRAKSALTVVEHRGGYRPSQDPHRRVGLNAVVSLHRIAPKDTRQRIGFLFSGVLLPVLR